MVHILFNFFSIFKQKSICGKFKEEGRTFRPALL